MKPSVLKALNKVAPQHIPAIVQMHSESADDVIQYDAHMALELNNRIAMQQMISDKRDTHKPDYDLPDFAAGIRAYVAEKGTDDLVVEFNRPYFESVKPEVRRIVGSALVAEMRNRNTKVPDLWYDAQA